MGSFRQLLLIAFLLIAGLLAATSLRAVAVFERLLEASGKEADRALTLHAAGQALAARTAGMERTARQSLVLNDSLLRRRFDDEWAAARAAVQQLADAGVAGQAAVWNGQADAIAAQLRGPSETALDRERAVAADFRELEALNTRIGAEMQAFIQARDRALRVQLESERARLMQQVVGAIVLTVVLALAFGLWLARPFQRLEDAIVQLGEGRLHDPIALRHGPSDVRKVSQQLEWLRLRLTELDADKARFLRHVSHELKTPLAALREGVAVLEDGVAGPLGGDQREVVRILRQNTLSLQGQIEALLRFNAAAFEARQLLRQPTDLLALLHEQVEAQQLQWQARQLDVRVEGDSRVVPVDASRLGTAVANLLSNAIRFSPPGGTVRLQLSSSVDRTRIDVHDQGPGVAEADGTRIFEPFFRGERQPADALRGSGIGLSIVQEYVAAHGGRVALVTDSATGHFRIELPHAN